MPSRCVAALSVLLCVAQLCSSELALPSLLTPLTSREGQAMLLTATIRDDYFLLSEHFVSQTNGAFCGPASAAMVLNALNTTRPLQDPSSMLVNPSYAYYTQVNVFNPATEAVVPQSQVRQEGMALPQLSAFLAVHPGVGSSYTHTTPATVSLDTFRTSLLAALAQPRVFVIVNFDRAVLQELGGGHHSPAAAYHADSDSVLILDVSRYKYSSWWVPVSKLYDSASKTLDSSTKLPRGLAFVWAVEAYPGSAPDFSVVPTSTDNGHPPIVMTASVVPDQDGISVAAATGLAVAMVLCGVVVGVGATVLLRWGSSVAARRGMHLPWVAALEVHSRSAGDEEQGALKPLKGGPRSDGGQGPGH